jgi:hypothetical protein
VQGTGRGYGASVCISASHLQSLQS